MSRGPPDPSTEFEARVSAVAQPHANPAPDEGSLFERPPAPYGLANVTWFRTLKISALNCTVSRSLNLNSLVNEKSQFLYPPSRKVLRPALPMVPYAGGTRTDLPLGET